MTLATLLAIVALLGLSPISSERCSIISADGSTWRPTVARTVDLVHRAEFIALATATRADTLEYPNGTRAPAVAFRVTEVIAGAESLPPELLFSGHLSDDDDFNPGTVPYATVRPAGQRGSCYAHTYRLEANYLFLLSRPNEHLTPYWAPLAPVNEQVRGADDPWVTWVRAERARGR